jgi:putative protein kinase ArgK-like GTPase of G3E family
VIRGKLKSKAEKGLLMNILKGILDGNPRAVGRAITLVKNGDEGARERMKSRRLAGEIFDLSVKKKNRS